MKLTFPSQAFDDAVAAACDGSLSDEQASALNELLRSDPAARDEYLLRVELHARLASDGDLFASSTTQKSVALASDSIDARIQENVIPQPLRSGPRQALGWAAALAACVTLVAGGWWARQAWKHEERTGATSKAVAMLNGVVDAKWNSQDESPRVGAPLDPGLFRLESGLAQVVFYSGARVVIEGPAEFELISSSKAFCRRGKVTTEVPPEARGFQVNTSQMKVTDLGTLFGLDVKDGATELHVFKGAVDFLPASGGARQSIPEGFGAVAEASLPPRRIAASRTAFASMFDLQGKSLAAESSRYDRWQAASLRLNEDPTLLVHFDFEHTAGPDWRLPNASKAGSASTSDGTIVGCQWIDGRWQKKPALEFRGVSDRVRLNVPGEFDSLTLATWVRVQGLDRQFNSLFMCDGFDAGTVHWLIRNDGVLGLTVIGPGAGNYQIVASPPVLPLDQFGTWVHLAVVLDGPGKRVSHYVNAQQVSEKPLKMQRPFRIGTAELGNWNGRGFPDKDPFMIRNFSGAIDEFCLFSRALPTSEIRALYLSDKAPVAR